MPTATHTGAMPMMRQAIHFFERNGHMGPFAIRGGENNPPNPNPNPDPNADPDADLKLGDKGKAALKAERDARAAAEKAASDAAKELEALRKAESDRQAEKAKADEAEAAERGEYKTLAEKHKADAEDKETKVVQLSERLGTYQKAIAPLIEGLEKDLPKEAMADYNADADPADRLAWLQARKALVTTLRPADPTRQRVPGTPNPLNGAAQSDEIKSLVSKQQAGYG